ncbi:hypothetical protein [Mycolicibacterium grossiae]|uniref:hypothetical protein n=1 Tax=Mycolicibacterium grossiae TaxID=1552759 RepID=UPI000F78495F|nr:hypothetical protein [Mycolicibacterium grossiae]
MSDTDPGTPPPSTLTPAQTSGPISEATWTDGKWPLLVFERRDQVLRRRQHGHLPAGGAEYGLNQTAIRFGGYPDVKEIVAEKRLTGYIEINGQRQPVPVGDIGGLIKLSDRVCASKR